MALLQIKFAPGIDKQDTSCWSSRVVGLIQIMLDLDMDFQKKLVAGNHYLQILLVGVARKQHAFVDKDGNRYVAIGTDKFLIIYFEGQFFDVSPLATATHWCNFYF